MKQKERYIFRYLGDSKSAKVEFEKLRSEREMKIIETTPYMILGETSPSFVNRIKSIFKNWLVVPTVTYDLPDHQVQLKRSSKAKK
jgi:hypothetical protein